MSSRKTLRLSLDADVVLPGERPPPGTVENPVERVVAEELEVDPGMLHHTRRGTEHIPTDYSRRQVKLMAAMGLKQDHIAYLIGCAPGTLRTKYADEMQHGAAYLNLAMAKRLTDIALYGQGKESMTALIFWLKTKGGWREQYSVAHTGHTGEGPVQHEHTIGREVTHEERAIRLAQILNAGTAAGGGQAAVQLIRAMVAQSGAPVSGGEEQGN